MRTNMADPPGSNAAPRSLEPGLLDSDFIRALRAQFFDADYKPLWPGDPAGTQRDRANEEIPAVLKSLLKTFPVGDPLPDAPPGTAAHRVKAAADAAKWPLESRVPSDWQQEMGKYRYFEIAWAVNIMVEAFARTGGGGGPREWPSGGNS